MKNTHTHTYTYTRTHTHTHIFLTPRSTHFRPALKRQTQALGPLLKAVDPSTLADPEQRSTYFLALKAFEDAEAVGSELAGEKSRLAGVAYGSWAEARAAGAFGDFEPDLEACFELAKRIAKLKAPSDPPYTTMLDEFERGIPESRIDEMFGMVEEVRFFSFPYVCYEPPLPLSPTNSLSLRRLVSSACSPS